MDPNNAIKQAFNLATAATKGAGKPSAIKVKIKYDRGAQGKALKKKAVQYGAKTDSNGTTRV
jgi:hypothetical protein